MLELLKKPHPFIFNVYSVIIPSGITFLILLIFSPFGLQDLRFVNQLLLALVISIIVAFGIFSTFWVLKKIASGWMIEDNWTLGKEILLVLFTLFVISVIIFISFLLFFGKDQSIILIYSKTIGITILISLLPIVISILFEQYRHQKSQLSKAIELTKSLEQKVNVDSNQKEVSVLLKSENGDVELRLELSSIVYIKSDGNYLEVYYLYNGKVLQKLIRNRLKLIEEILPKQQFFRCHNSYIVNGNHIVNVNGNARNLILDLQKVNNQIPVSRSKANLIDSFLENLR